MYVVLHGSITGMSLLFSHKPTAESSRSPCSQDRGFSKTLDGVEEYAGRRNKNWMQPRPGLLTYYGKKSLFYSSSNSIIRGAVAVHFKISAWFF